jgi:hypothetical protein
MLSTKYCRQHNTLAEHQRGSREEPHEDCLIRFSISCDQLTHGGHYVEGVLGHKTFASIATLLRVKRETNAQGLITMSYSSLMPGTTTWLGGEHNHFTQEPRASNT